jgi:hypothetical protein
MPRQGVHRDLLAARRLFRLYALPLGHEASLDELLDRYCQAMAQTGKTMHYLGVAAACEHCALKGGESCCFPGVENKYDKVLLLINFLLGYPPPEKAEIKGKCLFLGKQGCKLLARHYYCQRFLCDDLKAELGEEAIQHLNGTVAQELAVGWEVEQALRQWLKKVEE